MKKEEFKEMFLSIISHGWGEYDNRLKEVTNDRKRLAKLHNTVRLVAYRNQISEHDALICLIRRGRV